MYGNKLIDTIRAVTALSLSALLLSGCGGGGSDSGFVAEPPPDPPTGNSPPQISGTPSGSVKIGDMYSFTPNASDPDGDPLTFSITNRPNWASFDTGTGELSGQPTPGDVDLYDAIVISVTDGQATASLLQFAISVDQAGTVSTTLTWTAPTRNEDGTTLIDLEGYKLYWGPTAGDYPNSVTINNAGITTYVVDDLTPGTYVFVAIAFNNAGEESRFSAPATKVLQ